MPNDVPRANSGTLPPLLGTLLAAAIGTGVYESREASRWRQTALALQADNSSLSNRLDSAAKERTPAVRNDAALQAERDRLQRATAELLKLRGENARLRAVEQQLTQLKPATEQPRDAFTQSVLDLTTKATKLNGHLEKAPHLRIPELAFLKESDWIQVARRAKFDSDEDVRESLMALRSLAKHNAYPLWQDALKAYLADNGGEAPADVQALRPYFREPIDDAILQRYRVIHSGPVPANPTGPVWLIEETGAVDDRHDTRMRLGLGSLDVSPRKPGG